MINGRSTCSEKQDEPLEKKIEQAFQVQYLTTTDHACKI